MIAKLLMSKLAGPIASGVAALLLLVLVFVWAGAAATERSLRDENGRLLAQRDQALRDLGTCRGNTDRLQGDLDQQNTAVDAMKLESNRRVAEAEKAAAAARAGSARALRDAKAILAAKPGADQCASADELILGSLK